jgi:hypothetical protein
MFSLFCGLSWLLDLHQGMPIQKRTIEVAQVPNLIYNKIERYNLKLMEDFCELGKVKAGCD